VKTLALLSVILALAASEPTVSIHDVSVFVSIPGYTGPCPVTLSFTVAMDGDPQTIFGWQLSGDAIATTKEAYGYMPPGGSTSFDQDIRIDSGGSGAHYVQATIHYSKRPGAPGLTETIQSEKVAYTVTCVAASPSPAPTPSPLLAH